MSRYAFLHHEGGITGPDGVIFVCHRRAEQRHDFVAHEMTYGPLVPVHRVDHQFEYRVEQPASIFRIATEQKLQRALDVGKCTVTCLRSASSVVPNVTIFSARYFGV